jgi:hypothetical protein
MSWTVESTRAISPDDGSNCDASYLIKLSRGDETAESIVGFVAPSAVASGGYAEEALSRFLRDDRPPNAIAIGVDGTVSVVSTGWRAPSPAPAAKTARTLGGSGRARRRTRGG